MLSFKFSSRLIFFSLLLVVFACSENAIVDNEEMELAALSAQEVINPELHAPNANGEKFTFRGTNYNFNYEVIDGEIIFEGDIILSKEELKELQLAANSLDRGAYHSHTNKRWNNNIVPFVITDNTLTARAVAAMNAIEAATNIVFRLRNPIMRTHRNHIRFVVGTGCSSAVGMQGGGQNINLAPACTIGNTIHEICHALGMWHEQTRNDRNNNVIVNQNNIQNGRGHNFDQNNCTIDSGNFDFGSIMMYGPCFFANACAPLGNCACTAAQATITTLGGNLYAIQRNALSAGDIAAVGEMYPWHPCTNVPCCGVLCIPGYMCVNGDCVVNPNDPPNCVNDGDCPPFHSCAGGNCIPW